MSGRQKQRSDPPESFSEKSNNREWFLLDCSWHDSVWTFKPSNVLDEGGVRIRWDFSLPNGECFTDTPHAQLLETCRQLIALVRNRSLSTGLVQRVRTVVGYFEYLREVVRWMNQTGFKSFAELDEYSLWEFQRHIKQRPGTARDSIAPATVLKYLYLFTYLYRFRDQLNDGLRFAPFPGRALGEVAGVHDGGIRRWPYTPDVVAIPLIQGSINLVTQGGGSILKAREVYSHAMAQASERAYCNNACSNAALRALREAGIVLPGSDGPIQSVRDLAQIVDMLYAACFVILAYLVGGRASEILHLRSGCVEQRGSGDAQVSVIVGSIFKRQSEYYGRPHEWVAPPVAIRAISVLEELSAPHRRASGREELWIRRSVSGATEWHSLNPLDTLAICSAQRIRNLLVRFANWLSIPKHENKAWVFTPHQGRKTFARFTALRDRTALFALAQHLGHRERAATDHGYCGSDYRLNEEIDAEVLEQSVSGWEHMLATPGLGGRAGAEIIANRPRFRGSRLKQEIKSYARMLVDAGLVLGVCNWGFCVYKENSSACLGNAAGPNPVRREPSTCARCANFVVSSKHLPYWSEQLRSCEALLEEPALPLQTLRIVRERVQEAKSLIRAFDTSSGEMSNGQTKKP